MKTSFANNSLRYELPLFSVKLFSLGRSWIFVFQAWPSIQRDGLLILNLHPQYIPLSAFAESIRTKQHLLSLPMEGNWTMNIPWLSNCQILRIKALEPIQRTSLFADLTDPYLVQMEGSSLL